MSLIRTEASIKYGVPDYDGMPEQFGLCRDWRPSEKWRGYNCEYIKPLGAIGPVADARPRSMSDSEWDTAALYNTSWAGRYPAFIDSVLCWQFTDGSVYPQGTAAATSQGGLIAESWCASVLPRFAFYMIRSMPPAGQGVFTGAHVTVPTIWDDEGTDRPGILTVYWPLAGGTPGDDSSKQFSAPFLHHIMIADMDDDGVQIFADGNILATGPGGSSRRQGSGREGWLFEYEEDSSLFEGGHVLIRNTENMDRWWHFHDSRLRLASKDLWDAAGFASGDEGYSTWWKWQIGVQGAIQTVNLTPLLYGAAAGAVWPEEPRPLPHEADSNEVEADAWDDTATWGDLVSDSSGWSVSTAQASDGTRRPQTTFTPPVSAVGRRPVLWLQTEDYSPQFTAAETDPRTDTDGDGYLEGLVWTWGKDWKGSRGSASFYRQDTAIYPSWEERGSCVLAMGWNSGAGASIDKEDISQAYIVPGGLMRDRVGEDYLGAPGLGPVQFAAYDVAILPDKPLIDLRQAGGMTVEDWAGMVAERLGIPSGKVYVDLSVASQQIPTNAIPSKPHLAAQDGESAGSHIAAVEKAADIRVCWNRSTSYVMWVDGGPPDYNPETSTIALEIDYDTLVEQNMIYNIEHVQTAARSANALKVRYGREDRLGGQQEYYQAQPAAHRAVYLRGDYWAYYEDPDADRDELVARYGKERKAGDGLLAWRMPLRIDLRPDMFVKVTDCPYMDIVADAVYQIETHTADQPNAESRLTSVRVYIDDEALVMMGTGGEFGDMHANIGVDAAATEGALGDYEGITGLDAPATSGAFDDDGANDNEKTMGMLGTMEDD